jgi:hypothetical protein
MRRVLLLLSAMAAALVMASAVALADHPNNGEVNCWVEPWGDPDTNICTGTDHADNIQGTTGSDAIHALAGDDSVAGDWGDDVIYGGDGHDFVAGHEENDTIYGGLGNDHLRGSADSDTIWAGKGADDIRVGGQDDYDSWADDGTTAPVDTVYAEGGNDTIHSHLDGNKDMIDCGPGGDTVYYDVGIDQVKSCEKKNPNLR